MFDSADDQLNVRPLSKEEAELLRQKNTPLSPWWVISLQVLVVLVVASCMWLVTHDTVKTYSLVWGGLCVIVPSSVFAGGLVSKTTLMNAGSAIAGFFLWEVVKLGLTLAMLIAAPRALQVAGQDLNWLTMLAGFVVVMKVYWLASYCLIKASKPVGVQLI